MGIGIHPRVVEARAVGLYKVELRFADGTQGTVDLSLVIVSSGGIFAELKEPRMFNQVQVDREAGTIVWPNGADVDPDVLYQAAHPETAARTAP